MTSSRTIRISKLFTLEMGHALLDHDGQCRNIHGHSYKLAVTLRGQPLDQPGHPKDGMVMDFTDLKKIVQRHILEHFDHALVLNAATPVEVTSILQQHFEKTVILPFQPTCENLLLYFVKKIRESLPPTVELYRVRLDETATSFAEWCAKD
jgi:6-pyruvoyltetrahydropterin/6-carboxytetrahydropterin synthase